MLGTVNRGSTGGVLQESSPEGLNWGETPRAGLQSSC